MESIHIQRVLGKFIQRNVSQITSQNAKLIKCPHLFLSRYVGFCEWFDILGKGGGDTKFLSLRNYKSVLNLKNENPPKLPKPASAIAVSLKPGAMQILKTNGNSMSCSLLSSITVLVILDYWSHWRWQWPWIGQMNCKTWSEMGTGSCREDGKAGEEKERSSKCWRPAKNLSTLSTTAYWPKEVCLNGCKSKVDSSFIDFHYIIPSLIRGGIT